VREYLHVQKFQSKLDDNNFVPHCICSMLSIAIVQNRHFSNEDECLIHDHKKTPQLISFLFDIRFQRAIHQIKGSKKYYKLDIKCWP
jgi:hypothetical protein